MLSIQVPIFVLISLVAISAISLILCFKFWLDYKATNRYHTEVKINKDRLASIGVIWGEIAHEAMGSLHILESGLLAMEKILESEQASSKPKELLNKLRNCSFKLRMTLTSIRAACGHREGRKISPVKFDYYIDYLLCELQAIYQIDRINMKVINKSNSLISINSMAMEQVLSNVINTCYLAVKSQSSQSKKWINITCEDTDKGWILFIENGASLKENNIEMPAKLNQPFYTNLSTATGAKLDMGLTQKILSQYNGKLYLSSSDKCTSYVVEFPCQSFRF